MIKHKVYINNILLYSIIFFSFMGSNFLKFNFNGINFNITRILMLIPCIIVILDVIIHRNIGQYIKNKETKYIFLFLIIWSAYSIIGFYKTKDIYSYFIENFFLNVGTLNILYFLKNVKIKEHLNSVFNIISIAAVANCIYYLFLYFVQNNNIGAWYHNSNDLATLLLLSIPITIYLCINAKKIIIKIIYALLILIQAFSFANITSRACILGLGIAILFLMVINIIKNRKKIKEKKVLNYLVFALIIVSIVVTIVLFSKYLGKLSLKPLENVETSNEIRTNLIFNGLHFLAQDFNWLFGIGAGNATYYLKNISIYPTLNIYSFHNPLLEIAVTYGVIILLGFLITYFMLIKILVKMGLKSTKLISPTSVFLLFAIAMIIAGISSSGILTREWIWIAIAIILTHINYKDEEQN